MVETIEWTPHGVVMIDQTRLPLHEEYVTCRDYEEVATAIRDMIIRGAPAIGVAAAMGVAIGVQHATESNLEKIFSVLRAIGQVVVFVDEADQMAGKREGGDNDSGLSGRVYGMLAKEMSDTRNRGKIIWVFATSRPDLLEVDLKRPGRLDVHPLAHGRDDGRHVRQQSLSCRQRLGEGGPKLFGCAREPASNLDHDLLG